MKDVVRGGEGRARAEEGEEGGELHRDGFGWLGGCIIIIIAVVWVNV